MAIILILVSLMLPALARGLRKARGLGSHLGGRMDGSIAPCRLGFRMQQRRDLCEAPVGVPHEQQRLQRLRRTLRHFGRTLESAAGRLSRP